jgi:chemotaxis protein histidine kinase CheA
MPTADEAQRTMTVDALNQLLLSQDENLREEPKVKAFFSYVEKLLELNIDIKSSTIPTVVTIADLDKVNDFLHNEIHKLSPLDFEGPRESLTPEQVAELGKIDERIEQLTGELQQAANLKSKNATLQKLIAKLQKKAEQLNEERKTIEAGKLVPTEAERIRLQQLDEEIERKRKEAEKIRKQIDQQKDDNLHDTQLLNQKEALLKFLSEEKEKLENPENLTDEEKEARRIASLEAIEKQEKQIAEEIEKLQQQIIDAEEAEKARIEKIEKEIEQLSEIRKHIENELAPEEEEESKSLLAEVESVDFFSDDDKAHLSKAFWIIENAAKNNKAKKQPTGFHIYRSSNQICADFPTKDPQVFETVKYGPLEKRATTAPKLTPERAQYLVDIFQQLHGGIRLISEASIEDIGELQAACVTYALRQMRHAIEQDRFDFGDEDQTHYLRAILHGSDVPEAVIFQNASRTPFNPSNPSVAAHINDAYKKEFFLLQDALRDSSRPDLMPRNWRNREYEPPEYTNKKNKVVPLSTLFPAMAARRPVGGQAPGGAPGSKIVLQV